LIFEVHRFSVHQQEFHGQSLSSRCLICHFKLDRRNGYSRSLGAVGSGQMKAGSPDAATNVKNMRSGFHVGKPGKMLDQLKLSFFF
jgi:hypothetical protein